MTDPPRWRPGHQWVYAWTAGSESGVKVVEVVEDRQINGQPFYVVRIGELDHLYMPDLRWAGSLRGKRVESRMTPPLPWFLWPLEGGRRWTHRGTYEDPTGRQQHEDSFVAVGEEMVEVPAGRFAALKIVRDAGGRGSDEYWYAPDVQFYVRWVGRRADVVFEERLQSYRAGSESAPDRPMPPRGTN